MSRTWQVVVVRAWQHDHRRIIRMTMSSDADPGPHTAYSTSSRSAGDRLARWLEERASDPPAAAERDPSARPGDEDDPTHEDDA